VAAAAPIVAELATGGPRSRFVVTSRVALRLYGEQEFPVPPLELPNPERMPPLAELASYDAVQLFVDRARAVRPDFRLTDDTARPIAELCRRLDGLPLAIELAAARVRMLSPQAIIARLGERLDLLSSGAVNMPERQRSLEGAIGWSVELLDEPPQRLLERLSIFAGGCSIDAAQAVCDPRHELFPDAVAGLETLLVSSLLTSTDTDGEPRFTLLETIREFALRRLRQRSELPGIAARHAAWTADLVEGSEEALRAGRGSQFARIELEYANIQAALRWAIDADAATSGLHICSSIWRFWQRKGLLAEGIWWTRALLELPSAAPRTRERAAALAALGSLSYWTDDAPATASAYDESLEIWQELGDDLGIAIGIYNLAFARMLEGNPDAAKALIRDSKARFEALQDSFWIAEVSNSLGYIEILAGNLDEGEALLRSALPLIAGDPVRQADMWTILAQVEWLRGNFDAARDAVRTGLALLRQSWDAPLALGMSEVRGLLEIAAGNVALGLRLHAGAAAMRERIGGGPPVMMINRGTELQDARALLGEEEADRIEAEGRNLTDDEVVTLAEMSQTTSARR
jgi:predicted ATPase